MRLSIATYNVHKCRGMDGRESPARIAAVLRELNADVVAIQETIEHHAKTISTELGLPFVFGENRKHRGHGYGNAVFSRFPIQTTHNYDLSVAGCEERGCLRADLKINGEEPLHIFNVHLGTGHAERRCQGPMLVASDMLNDVTIEAPRIVLGDFNEWTSGLTTRLLCSHLQSADRRRRSYPGFFPFLRLDHIYYDPSLKLKNVRLHRTPKALVASDHLPLIGEFDFGSQGPGVRGRGRTRADARTSAWWPAGPC